MVLLAIAGMLQLHVVQYTATDSSTWYVNSVLPMTLLNALLAFALLPTLAHSASTHRGSVEPVHRR